jgi:hypothetical protein
MYKLITKSRHFSESEWTNFETVFDALDYARKIGFPGEEFEVFKANSVLDSNNLKVATITVEEKLIC